MRLLRRLFRRLVLLADTLLLGAFALAYAARYLRPDAFTWWIQMVAIGLPFLSMAVVVAALICFAVGKRRVVHAVAFALVLVRFGFPLGGGAPQDGDFSVVTYNLPRFWGGMDDTVRARQVEDFVREAAPAVLAFQEAGSMAMDSFIVYNPQIAQAQHFLSYDAPIATGARYAHNTTMLRFTPDRVDNVRLTVVPGQPFTEFQRVYFTWHGRKAVLYNIHLQSYGRRKPWQKGVEKMFVPDTWRPFVDQYRDAIVYRAAEADTIRTLLDAETIPVIVAGDFNGTAHNWAYAKLSEGMTDAFKHAGRGWGATYHVKMPVARIDFVLAGEEWDVVSARVPAVRLSDHRPVAAALRWKETPPAADSLRTVVRPIERAGVTRGEPVLNLGAMKND